MIASTIDIHFFFIILLFLVPLRNLYVLYTETNFIRLARKIRYLGPGYHILNAVNLFTGVVLMVVMNYYVGYELLLMIPTSIYILVFEIKRYKKIRRITSKDYEEQTEFIAWAKKKYLADALLIAGVSLIAVVF